MQRCALISRKKNLFTMRCQLVSFLLLLLSSHWTERTVRALAQLELEIASAITNDLLHVLRLAGIPREGAAAASSCLAYLAEVDRRESSEFLVSG